MLIFGIYNELNKQLVLNLANNRDPRLFTTKEDVQEYLDKNLFQHCTVHGLKVVELEVTVGPARTRKDGTACWTAKPKPTVRILPSRRPESTSYPFVVSLFEAADLTARLKTSEQWKTPKNGLNAMAIKCWRQHNEI